MWNIFSDKLKLPKLIKIKSNETTVFSLLTIHM